MTEGMDKISSVIAELVDDGTFTKDALKRMQSVLANSRELEDLATSRAVEIKRLQAIGVAKDAEISALKGREAALTSREAAVKVREDKLTELEKSVAVSYAKAEVYGICFNTVFRNFTVNKNITGSVPVATNGGYPTNMPANENETTIVS